MKRVTKTASQNTPLTEPLPEPTPTKPSAYPNNSLMFVLVVLLLVASYLLGVLTTKVQYLENGKGTTAALGTNTTPAPIQPSGPPPKVDVATGHFPVLGNKDTKVTIIEFADFQCPFCERFHKDVYQNLKKDYVDTGKIKFAYRHYAFLGKESQWAAQASECSNEQGKFWEMHDYLFDHQAGENQGAFEKEKLKEFAVALGLNTDQFNSCLDTDKYAKNVSDDLAEGQKAGVQGTPATFVNGQLVSGAQPYETFKLMIDEELKKK